MGARSAGHVALLSIRPEYAEAILEGRKRVEFRRTPFARPVRSVVIYATSPVGMIIGCFEVEAIEVDSPSALWERFHTVAGISRRRFRDYFSGTSRGYAIRVGVVTEFEVPRPLDVLGRNLVAPQSFRYLPDDQAERLIGRRVAA